MTWQESNSHFFPPSVSVAFAPSYNFIRQGASALFRGASIRSMSAQTRSGQFFWFSYLLPIVVDLNIARTLDATGDFWCRSVPDSTGHLER
jgi:hypothetical protein